jgi:hypothetical protein
MNVDCVRFRAGVEAVGTAGASFPFIDSKSVAAGIELGAQFKNTFRAGSDAASARFAFDFVYDRIWFIIRHSDLSVRRKY